MARAYKCPLKDPLKCTTCGKVTFTKGKKPAAPAPCKKGTKGCKRGLVKDIETRAPSVPMDKTTGIAWADGDVFGTTGLGSCSFVVIFDKKFIIGSHIPPARATRDAKGELVLTHTGEQVINGHLKEIKDFLKNVDLKTAICMLVKSDNLDPTDEKTMKDGLKALGLKCQERVYNPTQMTQGGLFAVSRQDGSWPPKGKGPA